MYAAAWTDAQTFQARKYNKRDKYCECYVLPHCHIPGCQANKEKSLFSFGKHILFVDDVQFGLTSCCRKTGDTSQADEITTLLSSFQDGDFFKKITIR